MNVNFGLFPALPPQPRIKGKDRKKAMSARALADLAGWLGERARSGRMIRCGRAGWRRASRPGGATAAAPPG